MFGLGIAPKENFLAYSTQFIFLIIRLVPGNVVMVAIDMCEKSPITVEPHHFQQSCKLYVCRFGGSELLLACFSSMLLILSFILSTANFGELPLVAALQFLVHFSFLILQRRKAFWRALSAGGFLINIWYCISCLLNINSVLAIQRGFLHT